VPDTPHELISLGYQARRNAQPEQGKELFSKAVELSRAGPDPLALADSLVGLGQIDRDLKNNRIAIQHYREAVDIYQRQPDRLRLAHTIRHLADILREDGSLEDARPHYEEALRIYREHRATPPLDLANTIRGLARLRAEAGETEEAKSLWQEARSLYESVNVQAGVKESDDQIARL